MAFGCSLLFFPLLAFISKLCLVRKQRVLHFETRLIGYAIQPLANLSNGAYCFMSQCLNSFLYSSQREILSQKGVISRYTDIFSLPGDSS